MIYILLYHICTNCFPPNMYNNIQTFSELVVQTLGMHRSVRLRHGGEIFEVHTVRKTKRWSGG